FPLGTVFRNPPGEFAGEASCFVGELVFRAAPDSISAAFTGPDFKRIQRTSSDLSSVAPGGPPPLLSGHAADPSGPG
ncbi:hypothetical protein, partial [Streptomyces rubiginosohelvolus]